MKTLFPLSFSEGKRVLCVLLVLWAHNGREGLFSESFEYIVVLVDAPVTQEGPPSAHFFAVIEVNVYYYAFFFVVGSAVKELSLWSCYERGAPELYAWCLTTWVWFKAYAVYCYHW